MATVLEVRGLTRMIELPPKPPKPPVVLETPALGAAASPADSPSMLRLDSGKSVDEAAEAAAAKLEEEKKAAAAAAAAREDLPRMRVIFSNVSFSLARGTTLALVGPAKCGKTQLLRAIAQLDPSHGGDVLLNDRLPEEIGYTAWRTRVAYVQQKQTRLTEATGGRKPREYFNSIMNLNAHKERRTRFADPMSFGRKWGLDDKCFESPWETLSPSEHQRMLLAIALACKPEVVLLDEPTGVLDMSLALTIEKTIRSLGLSVIWATRDVYQAERVGDTVIEFNSLTHIDLNAINQAAEDLGEDELAALIREAIEANQEASRIAAEVGDELAHGGGGGGGGQGGASGFTGRSPRLGAAPAGSPALKPMSLGIAVVHEGDEWDEKSPLA